MWAILRPEEGRAWEPAGFSSVWQRRVSDPQSWGFSNLASQETHLDLWGVGAFYFWFYFVLVLVLVLCLIKSRCLEQHSGSTGLGCGLHRSTFENLPCHWNAQPSSCTFQSCSVSWDPWIGFMGYYSVLFPQIQPPPPFCPSPVNYTQSAVPFFRPSVTCSYRHSGPFILGVCHSFEHLDSRGIIIILIIAFMFSLLFKILAWGGAGDKG